MRRNIIFSIVATIMMLATPAQATIIKGYVLIDGDQVEAEYTKLGENTVSVGSGKNACIKQYTAGHLTIPSSITVDGTTYNVTEISNVAFRFCDQITSVEIKENVTRIGNFAFVGCSKLSEITLPASLESIGSGAFINTVSKQSTGSVTCLGTTPPRWEYNDVFAFHDRGISDPSNAVISTEIELYVPEGYEETYRTSNYTNPSLGWTGSDGWGSFTSLYTGVQSIHIYTPNDLNAVREIVNNHGKYNFYKNIYIENDIDMAGVIWDWGIGNDETHPFEGNFHGNGNTISNLCVRNGNGPAGLFSYFGGKSVDDVQLVNFVVQGVGGDVGAFAGVSGYCDFNSVWVEGCNYYVDNANIGGILGRCLTTGGANFYNCVVKDIVDITFVYSSPDPNIINYYAGGIVGSCYGGVVRNCAVIGDVKLAWTKPFAGYIDEVSIVNVNNSYATDALFESYTPLNNESYNNYVVLSGNKTFDVINKDKTTSSLTLTSDKFNTLFMIPALGLEGWVFAEGEFPLPFTFEDKMPVKVNQAVYRPNLRDKERVNGLMLSSGSPWTTFLNLSDNGYRSMVYFTSRLWIDENFNYNSDVAPNNGHISSLPIGTAQISAFDGVRYDRKLFTTQSGTKPVTASVVAMDDEGNPVIDDNGNYVIVGDTTLYEESVFSPTGYTVYLPYKLHHNYTFRLFEPESVTAWNGVASVVMNEIDDEIIYPWVPYYIVVNDAPVDLSTGDEVTLFKEPSDTDITFGPNSDYRMCGTKNPMGALDNKFVVEDLDKFKPATSTIKAWESYFTAPAGINRIEISRELRFYEDIDNSVAIEDFDGTMVKATLRGRTLYKDGTWNTLCLPFDVISRAGSLIEDAIIYDLSNSTIDNDGTITLNFRRVDNILAGRPYLVKWESGEDIINPSFYGVTIKDVSNEVITAGPISMMGHYAPMFVLDDAPILYIGANNQLCRPTESMVINAFRACFYYDPKEEPETLGAIKLNFEPEVVTRIDELLESRPADPHWYTIDGRVLPSKPSAPGIYINNGKKIIIK